MTSRSTSTHERSRTSPLTPTPTFPRFLRLCLLALTTLILACVTAPAIAQSPDALVWLDRSSGTIGANTTAVVTAPGQPRTIYVAGRGVVAVSHNGGITWKPSLLLYGRDAGESKEQEVIQLSPDDLEAFDDLEASTRIEAEQEDLLDELTDLYGEDLAEQLVFDLRGEIEAEAIEDLVDEAALAMQERDYEKRLQRLRSVGLEEDDARQLAGGALSIWQLYVDPEQPAALYAATGSGLFRSEDRGQHWRKLLQGIGMQGQGVLSVLASRQGEWLLAGTDEGLQISHNSGHTWKSPTGALSNEPVRVLHRASPTRLYATTPRALHRSDDSGESWQAVTLTDFDGKDIQDLTSPEGQPDVLLAATLKGLYRSDDAGQSWRWLTATGLDARAVQQVELPRRDLSLVYITTSSRAFYTQGDSGTWRTLGRAMSADGLTDLTSTGTNAVWIASRSGLFQSISADQLSIETEMMMQLEKIWANEPTPTETIAAGLIFSGLQDLPGDAWNARIQLSVFAPRLDLMFRYQQTRYDREIATFQSTDDIDDGLLNRAYLQGGSNTLPDTGELTFGELLDYFYNQDRLAEIGRSNFEWRLMLYWDLGDMVFNGADLAMSQLDGQLRRGQRRLVKRLLRLLVKRRQLQLVIASTSQTNLETELDQQLHLEEYNALINALTGGFYLNVIYQGQDGVAAARSEQIDLFGDEGLSLMPMMPFDPAQ